MSPILSMMSKLQLMKYLLNNIIPIITKGGRMMRKLQKHVVITGAGSALVAAVAKKYNEEDFYVTLIGRNQEKLERTASTFKNSSYSIYTMDVSSYSDVTKTFEKITSEVQPIDILINNAGLGFFDLAENIEVEQIDQMIDINLKGTIYCSQQVIGTMKERNSGSIINITSTAGMQGKINESAYCASKFGVRGFTESIIKELSETDVHVHAIYMSGMDTPFWDGVFEEDEKSGMMQPYDV